MFEAAVGFEVLALAVLAGVAGTMRGFSGFGAALVFVPLAARILSPPEAVVVMLVMDFAGTAQMLPEGLRDGDRRAAGQMALGALVGVPLGVWLLTIADPLVFRWAASLLSLLLLVMIALGVRLRGRPGPRTRGAVGLVAGVMGGFSGMAGPPVILFQLGGTDGAAGIRANLILFFSATFVLSGISLGLSGLIRPDLVILGLVIILPYMLGITVGGRLFRWRGDALFRRAAYVVVGGAAVMGLPLF